MDSALAHELKSYDTTHPNRGIALVINITKNRAGSEKDLEAVVAVLRALKFDVRTFIDKTTHEIRAALGKVAREDHTYNDCLLMVVMAHGTKDTIKLTNRDLCINELWVDFVGNECPSLIGKPKLVFIQSCRGDKHDYGATTIKADSMPVPVDPVRVVIPMYADLLVMYSSYERYVSYRCEKEGTWFIQSLCQVLRANIAKVELLAMLTHVSYLVANRSAQMETGFAKQIPTIHSMLTKAFYFAPK
uniref:Caspase family p20 domain-containing protein n=1 Tax=Anopheles christyi TaxID=43041 RepID=A0A182KEP7_9DIPT